MSEGITATVAVVGDPAVPLPIHLPERFWTTPYEQRQRVMLEASADDSLGDVLQRAAEKVGAEHLGARIAFYAPDDDQQLDPRRASPVVPLVDSDGRVTWRHYWFEPTYRDLLRAHEAGALGGDPLRPYLVLEAGAGNGFTSDWNTVKDVWNVAFHVFEYIAAAGGAAAALSAAKRAVADRLRTNARAVQEVIELRGAEWSSRNGDPHDLTDWLVTDQPWAVADLAALLGCTEGQAEVVLWMAGFAQAPSGLWRKDADEEARLAGEITFAATHVFQRASEDQVRCIVGDEIERYFATGRVRPALGDLGLPVPEEPG